MTSPWDWTNADASRTHLCGEPVRDNAFNRFLTLTAIKIFGGSRKRWWSSACMLPLGFVIKTGGTKYHHLSEANTIQFVARNTIIPVPKVYCAFVKDDTTYIVMQRMKGEWIGDYWEKCSADSKKKILAHLKSMLDELRSLQPPANAGVESVVGGPLADTRVKEIKDDLFGPFKSVKDFHSWLRAGWDGEFAPYTGDMSPHAKAGLHVLETHRKNDDSRLTFTHGDLNETNVFVHDDKVVGIIDWSTGGWYPAWWEYAMTVVEGQGATCRLEIAKKYLQEFMEEARALSYVMQLWQK